MLIGGTKVYASGSQQSGGIDAPSTPLESGAEVAERNVVLPEEGTITAVAGAEEVAALRQLKEEKEPIPITTAEGSIPKCVVENVDRDWSNPELREPKFDVTIDWKQVFLAAVSQSTLVAVTADGKSSSKAGGGGNSQSSTGPDSKNASNGPSAFQQGRRAGRSDTSSALGQVGRDVSGWASSGGSGGGGGG